MLDCGFTLKETLSRLARLHVEPERITAVVVTHEHGDHVRGVGAFARKFGVPVWMTAGTWRACRAQSGAGPLPDIRLFSSHSVFAIGDVQVEPFPVPHDAHEPAQFVFSDGARRLGVLTDTGCSTPHIECCLNACDALLLECNHDRDLLFSGDYPPSLKERVGGRLGHLDNAASAAILGRLDTSRLTHLVAAHLSEKNNTPALARWALASVLGCAESWIGIADQDRGLGWRELAAN